MLAQSAARVCAERGDEITALDRAGLDIAEAESVRATLLDLRPDAVLNCAAYTNVDGAEANPDASSAANSDGVANLAAACREADAAFVTVSTDFVFRGDKDGFYTQRHAPDPQGVYARTKRDGEIRAFAECPRTIIVRSGWIFGTGGTNFLSVMPRLLADGKAITAINDSFGTPTYALHLARRLRDLAEADLPGVYHATNAGEGCSYYDVAMKVCEIGGFDKDLVKPSSYKDLDRPAPRPVNSRLACLITEKLGFGPLPFWQDALAEFITSEQDNARSGSIPVVTRA